MKIVKLFLSEDCQTNMNSEYEIISFTSSFTSKNIRNKLYLIYCALSLNDIYIYIYNYVGEK